MALSFGYPTQPLSNITTGNVATGPRPGAISFGFGAPPSLSGITTGSIPIAGAPPVVPPSLYTPPVPPRPMLPPVVRPPKLDFAAVQAQARKDAEGAVNPFYTKRLNDFLAEQASKRQQQQALADTSVQNLQDTLDETLKNNQLAEKRTAEDVGQNIADINQTEDQSQTDSGQAFDENRLALARAEAAGGSTGGIGSQGQEAAAEQFNTAEARQSAQVKQQRQAQQLFKTRTFEDLGRSGELATKAKAKGEKAVKFDLDRFITDQGFEEQNTRGELEAQRLEKINQEAANQAKLAYSRYLAGIADPAQLQAAAATYGGVF